ncbi:MAG: hypothetical protein ABIA97_00230 [Candidatus Omnitrophota bacterium]
MSRLNEIKSILEKISSKPAFTENTDTNVVSDLESSFSNLEGHLREYIQEITKKQILQIVDKLRNNKPVSEEELKYVELWIVGDAKYYTKFENNFEDWVSEMNRILKEVKVLAGDVTDLNLENCSKLRALSKDAVRNISDINYFIEQRERIRKFKESVAQIDKEERDTLVDILVSKLNSKTF